MWRARAIRISILLALLLISVGCGKKPAEPGSEVTLTKHTAKTEQFTVAGSGSNIPVTEKLAQAYQAKTGLAVVIPESIGSAGAVNAVKAGDLELGLISRRLTPEERLAGLKEIPYAQAAVVFAAHQNTTDTNVAAADIIDMLAGTKSKWSDSSKIVMLTRQDNDSTNQVLYELIPGYKKALAEANTAHRWQVFYRNSDMIAALKSTAGSFGLTTLPEIVQAQAGIKPLLLDGIAPNKENILNGSYKPVITLAFVYQDNLSSRAAGFVDFVFSPEGRQVLESLDAIPISR